jgi:hypothetical protein
MMTELDVSQVTGEIKMRENSAEVSLYRQTITCMNNGKELNSKFKQIIKDFDLSFGNDENSAEIVPQTLSCGQKPRGHDVCSYTAQFTEGNILDTAITGNES